MSKLSLKPESNLINSIKTSQFYEPILKKSNILITNMIATIMNYYELTDEELDIFKALYVKLYENDKDIECEITEKINDNTTIFNLILYMYSKIKTSISLNYLEKIKNYLNIDVDIKSIKEPDNDDISDKKYEKYMYNLSKLNHYVDFSLLGINIYSNRNKKYKNKKEDNIEINDDNDEENNEEEFEEIPL